MPCVSVLRWIAVSISKRRLSLGYSFLDLTSRNERLGGAPSSSTACLSPMRPRSSFSVFSWPWRDNLMRSTSSALDFMLFPTFARRSASIRSTASVNCALTASSSTACSLSALIPCCCASVASAVAAWTESPRSRVSSSTSERSFCESRRAWIVLNATTVRLSSAGVILTKGTAAVCTWPKAAKTSGKCGATPRSAARTSPTAA
mmetsp:Transcript_90247/g.263980  ORF Transcript_90247/g.263980 Transcript_90247/m.263980 type:complete len:204 (-) Transcript_90247:520-1131(-)